MNHMGAWLMTLSAAWVQILPGWFLHCREDILTCIFEGSGSHVCQQNYGIIEYSKLAVSWKATYME